MQIFVHNPCKKVHKHKTKKLRMLIARFSIWKFILFAQVIGQSEFAWWLKEEYFFWLSSKQ